MLTGRQASNSLAIREVGRATNGFSVSARGRDRRLGA